MRAECVCVLARLMSLRGGGATRCLRRQTRDARFAQEGVVRFARHQQEHRLSPSPIDAMRRAASICAQRFARRPTRRLQKTQRSNARCVPRVTRTTRDRNRGARTSVKREARRDETAVEGSAAGVVAAALAVVRSAGPAHAAHDASQQHRGGGGAWRARSASANKPRKHPVRYCARLCADSSTACASVRSSAQRAREKMRARADGAARTAQMGIRAVVPFQHHHRKKRGATIYDQTCGKRKTRENIFCLTAEYHGDAYTASNERQDAVGSRRRMSIPIPAIPRLRACSTEQFTPNLSFSTRRGLLIARSAGRARGVMLAASCCAPSFQTTTISSPPSP